MKLFDPALLNNLYIPPIHSHKGQNGKVLVIGGSSLFHAASIWSLEIVSKIVDMTFYVSVKENTEIVQKMKEKFRNGIIVSNITIDEYAQESDSILIGPGMVRTEKDTRQWSKEKRTLQEIMSLDEGERTYFLTKYVLEKYPEKNLVIDAGALQMMEKEWLRNLTSVIITPHEQEFERLFDVCACEDHAKEMAKEYGCVILLKGVIDMVVTPSESITITGGNAGMTKGGTGDVLAGLVTALFAKNDATLSACAGSFFNKKAGEALFEKVGYYFNSSDLVAEIPRVMKKYHIS